MAIILGDDLGDLGDLVVEDFASDDAGRIDGTGNAGANAVHDACRFATALSSATNVDRIGGFVAADDTIQLENAIFTPLVATGTLAAEDRILYDALTGQLWYDSDGTGAAAKLLFATLIGAPPLGAADFVVT